MTRWLLVLLFALVVSSSYAKPKDDDDDDKPVKPAPAQTVPADADTPAAVEAPALAIDKLAQEAGGIECAVLPSMSFHAERHGYGTVLEVGRLIELGTAINQAKAQLAAAEAKAGVARSASERANSLFKEEQNISAAQRQSAEASYRGEQASLTSASLSLKQALAMARQEFGPGLGQALLDGSPLVGKLIDRDEALIQVTLPGNAIAAPPKTAKILAAGATIEATYLSLAGKVDPRIQGVALLFTAPSHGGDLQPGLSIEAILAVGDAGQGVTVPESAVVRWQGQSWIYRRTAPESFVRHLIRTDIAGAAGGYIVTDLGSGAEIVTRGAELLLSQEFRSKNAPADDD